MTLYSWLCRGFPAPVVHWAFVVGRAVLIVLVVLYSDVRYSDFAYLRL